MAYLRLRYHAEAIESIIPNNHRITVRPFTVRLPCIVI